MNKDGSFEYPKARGPRIDVNRVQSTTDFDQSVAKQRLNRMNLLACDNTHMQYSVMTGRVKRVLFIGNEYDFFQVDSCFMNQGFTTCPDFIWKTYAEATELLRSKQKIDVIISMHETNDHQMWEDMRVYRAFRPKVSIYPVCVDINSNYPIFNNKLKVKAFVWHGDPMLFLALIKLTEDEMNLEKDVLNGPCGIVLYVEDTCRFYSEYLPHIFGELLERTKNLQGYSAKHALARRRARPKIIFKTCLNDALEILNLCDGKVLAVISDIEYPLSNRKDGSVCPYVQQLLATGLFTRTDCPHRSGIILRDSVKKVEGMNPSITPPPRIPFLFLSTATEHKDEVRRCSNCLFAQKDSGSILNSLQVFFDRFAHLSPVFYALDPINGIPLINFGPATNYSTLLELIKAIPDDSLLYHGQCNSFSNWLFNSGEFGISLFLHPYKTRNFNNEPGKVRTFIVSALLKYMYERTHGLSFDFDPYLLHEQQFVMTAGGGSTGGKAHGILYLDRLLSKINEALANDPEVNESQHILGLPRTLILTTTMFQTFVHDHHFGHFASPSIDEAKYPDAYIAAAFVAAPLRADLIEALHQFLVAIDVPLVVRPSSLLEDSNRVPVSGVYSSFFLGNSHPNIEIRLTQLMIAIKLVYASTYFHRARSFRQSVGLTSSSEAMAVLIQEVPGQLNAGTGLFYPHISCSSLSVNFYPVKSSRPMRPEDGIANMMVGLSVVQKGNEGTNEAEKTKQYRFSPAVPNVSYLLEEQDYDRQTQQHFYAIDLNVDQSCTEAFLAHFSTQNTDLSLHSQQLDQVDLSEMTNEELHLKQQHDIQARSGFPSLSTSPTSNIAMSPPSSFSFFSSTSASLLIPDHRLPPNNPAADIGSAAGRQFSFPSQSPGPSPRSQTFGLSSSPNELVTSTRSLMSQSSQKNPPFPVDRTLNPLLAQNSPSFGLPCFVVKKTVEHLRKDNIIQQLGAEYRHFQEENMRQRYHNGIPEYSQIYLTFSNILSPSSSLQLPRVIQHVLRVTKEAMKAEVQFTFSVNITSQPYEITLLELRPAITTDSFAVSTFSTAATSNQFSSFARFSSFRQPSSQNFVSTMSYERAGVLPRTSSHLQINLSTAFSFPHSSLLCSSTKVIGVPSVSPPLFHIVYPDRHKFDILKTFEIAQEIATINEVLGQRKQKFVLIGFGRWGTKQPSLGIPVKWTDIRNASALVETVTDTFFPDPSDGNHFLQNMIDAKIPWIYVKAAKEEERKQLGEDYRGDIMNWGWIDEKERDGRICWEGKYVKCLNLCTEEERLGIETNGGDITSIRIVVDTLNSRARILGEVVHVKGEVHEQQMQLHTLAQLNQNMTVTHFAARPPPHPPASHTIPTISPSPEQDFVILDDERTIPPTIDPGQLVEAHMQRDDDDDDFEQLPMLVVQSITQKEFIPNEVIGESDEDDVIPHQNGGDRSDFDCEWSDTESGEECQDDSDHEKSDHSLIEEATSALPVRYPLQSMPVPHQFFPNIPTSEVGQVDQERLLGQMRERGRREGGLKRQREREEETDSSSNPDALIVCGDDSTRSIGKEKRSRPSHSSPHPVGISPVIGTPLLPLTGFSMSDAGNLDAMIEDEQDFVPPVTVFASLTTQSAAHPKQSQVQSIATNNNLLTFPFSDPYLE